MKKREVRKRIKDLNNEQVIKLLEDVGLIDVTDEHKEGLNERLTYATSREKESKEYRLFMHKKYPFTFIMTDINAKAKKLELRVFWGYDKCLIVDLLAKMELIVTVKDYLNMQNQSLIEENEISLLLFFALDKRHIFKGENPSYLNESKNKCSYFLLPLFMKH